jgi:tRNA A37 methylthiotransferase MiaB
MKIHLRRLNPCDGRKLNIDRYERFLLQNGHELVPDLDQADLILVWSCGFRQDYKEHSLAQIRRLADTFPGPVVVGGCLPDIDRTSLEAVFSGQIIPWKEDAALLETLFGRERPLAELDYAYAVGRRIEDLAAFRRDNPHGDATFMDQFLKLYISQGCSMHCTYCSEKLTFPPYTSFPEDRLLAACRDVIERTGERRIMLQADSTGEYGRDTGSSLRRLTGRLKALAPGVLVGMQNVHPRHFIEQFEDFEAMVGAGDFLHLRVPVQSAAPGVLRAMGREYGPAEIERIFKLFGRLGFRDFSTDIIVGFPGETAEDFQRSLDFILGHLPTYVNLSTFTPAPGTPAASMGGQVPREEAVRRVMAADAAFRASGVYCNTDGGDHSRDRRRRLSDL